MKFALSFLAIFLPCLAQASQIANCDRQAYDVTIINGGAKRVVTLNPNSASVEEIGPTVSFQLEGQRPVSVTGQADQYCIWHGHITIQRRAPGNDANGGWSLR